MASVLPIYDPGQKITGRATGAAVSRGRILCVAAAKVDGQPTPVRHCGAADAPLGASEYDADQDAVTSVMRYGTVAPLEAAGTIDATSWVEVTTAGRVQRYSSGTRVGVALERAASGEFPLIDIKI